MPIVNTYINDTKLYHDLKSMDRDNFSYEGARALMQYLNNISEDIGQNIEYDPIAFCCEYSEYKTIGMLCDEYHNAPQADDFDCPDEWEQKAIEYFNDNTTVIEFNGGIIIQQF